MHRGDDVPTCTDRTQSSDLLSATTCYLVDILCTREARTLPVRGQRGHPVSSAFQMLDGSHTPWTSKICSNSTYHFLIASSVQALAQASCNGSGVRITTEG